MIDQKEISKMESHFKSLKTRDEKRLFVLSINKIETFKKSLEFEKISDSTIEIAFNANIGKKFTQERKYTPKFNDNDHLL